VEAEAVRPHDAGDAAGQEAERGLAVNAALAALPLAIVGAVVAWWVWRRGAYFTVNFYPGGIVLLLTLALMCAFVPWPGRLRSAPRVALVALLGLAAWTLLSASWSPSAVTGVEDGLRVAVYGAAFALGLWGCLLLGRRRGLALLPLAAAGVVVGVATLIALGTSTDTTKLFESDASLRFPLGYRNAAAAFFLMASMPLVGLAAQRSLDWRLRGVALGGTTLCLELAVLCQSRGAVFGAVAAVVVLLAVHPRRWAIAAWLGLAVALALPALPWLLDVFQDSGGDRDEALGPARDAARAAAATSFAAILAGFVAARVHARLEVPDRVRRAGSRVSIAGLAVAAVAAVVFVFSLEGGPFGALERQAGEFSAGTPDLTTEQSRYGFDLRSERGDFWRVSIDDLQAQPLTGEGAGGFRASYLLERDSLQQPEDPHSVEMLMASELGLPGVLLFATFIVAAVVGAFRSRKTGPEAGALVAAALSLAAYWLVHASVEWFWSYPGITLPAMFALGAAGAPALIGPPAQPRRALRLPAAAIAVVLSVLMVPLWLSERLTDQALDTWRSDPEAAYSDLDTAASLNPLADRPYVAAGLIAESLDDRERALAAARDAQERQPDDWAHLFLEARILVPVDPAAARRALDRAAALNPDGPEIAALRKRLDRLER
jgi:hypothetical protein